MTGINEDIVQLIRERLEHGQKTYGQEVQDNDPRDFLQEALEEALDGCVYLAASIIKLKKKAENYQRKWDSLFCGDNK